MSELVKANFRLAFRHEGEWENCYLADSDSMEDALLLGTMRFSIIRDNPKVFDLWKDCMKAAMAAAIEEILGFKPAEFREERAPEHERSGHG